MNDALRVWFLYRGRFFLMLRYCDCCCYHVGFHQTNKDKMRIFAALILLTSEHRNSFIYIHVIIAPGVLWSTLLTRRDYASRPDPKLPLTPELPLRSGASAHIRSFRSITRITSRFCSSIHGELEHVRFCHMLPENQH